MADIINILYMMFGYKAMGLMAWLQDYLQILNILTLIVSLFICYFGWKIFKFCLFCQGFLIGSVIGMIIGVFAGMRESGAILLLGAGVGLVIAILSVILYRLGVFFFFLGTGFLITTSIFSLSGQTSVTTMIVGAVVGAALGIFAAIFVKHFVIWGSAIYYGYSAGYAIGLMMESQTAVFIFAALFIVTGIIVQYLMERKFGKKKQPQMQPQYAAPNGYAAPPQYAQQPVQYAQPVQYTSAPAPVAQPAPAPVAESAPTATMFCIACGTAIESNALFCPVCGTKQ